MVVIWFPCVQQLMMAWNILYLYCQAGVLHFDKEEVIWAERL